MRALITGFEPFGGDSINPSFEVLALLPARLGDLAIETSVLPCRFGEAKEYGWSEEKARHYAVPEREDFGAYVKRRGFSLE